MTPIQFFYKLGESQALADAMQNEAFRSFIDLYPPQMRGYVGSIFDSDDNNEVRSRAEWFANNFLRNSGGLDRKLLRMALKKGVNSTASTLGEGAETLTGSSKR